MTKVRPSVLERSASIGHWLRGHRVSWPLAWMGLLALVLVWTRLVGLDQSLQHDEVFTVQHYVIPGPDGILFGRYEPNNHVLFNWLTWVTTSLLGQSEALDRIWGVLPGLGAVAILGWWSWRRLGPWTAVAVVSFAVAAPLNLELVKQVRGYGLTSLAGVLLIVTADRVMIAQSRRNIAAWGVAGFIGICTHMMFVLAFLGSALALALIRANRRTVALTVAVVGIAAAAFYGPLLGQMVGDFFQYYASTEDPSGYIASIGQLPLQIAADAGRPPLAWHGLLSGPGGLVAPGVELFLTGDTRPSCQVRCYVGRDIVAFVLPVLALAAVGSIALWRSDERRLLAVITMPVAFTFLVLTLARVFVADRFVSHLLLFVVLLMAIGVTAIGQALSRQGTLRPVVVTGGSFLALFGLAQVLDLHSRWVATPFEDMKQVGAIVRGSNVEPVITNSTRPNGLYFYIGGGRLRTLPTDELEAEFCSRRAFVYVDHPLRSTHADTACLVERGAAKLTVVQRGRGGFIDIWIAQREFGGASARR
jgi:hypothetical protein